MQLLSFFIVKDLSYPKLLLLAYCFGGVINHSLMLGMYTYICIIIYIIFKYNYYIIIELQICAGIS